MGQTYYLLYDQIGSLRAVVDSTALSDGIVLPQSWKKDEDAGGRSA